KEKQSHFLLRRWLRATVTRFRRAVRTASVWLRNTAQTIATWFRHASRPKQILYAAAAVMALVWLVIGLNVHWSNQTAILQSQNAARLNTLAGDIDALAMPNSIGYGKTDSLLSVVTQKYADMRQQIADMRPRRASVLNSYPTLIFKQNAIRNQANGVFADISAILQESEDALNASEKLLRYAPDVDLQPYASGDEEDASERLASTETGLQAVVTALKDSNVSYNDELVAKITPLLGRAEKLKPADVKTWTNDVHEVQKFVLNMIDEKTVEPLQVQTATLRELSGQYISS
ncbi:hypothetical protein B7Z17_01580, partial [Candidatus Saccharibacteria bacterium 32-49-10]